MSAISDEVGRYGAVAVGLALGTAAKWGLALGDGRTPTWRGILADMLLLSLLGLIAVAVSDWAGLTGNAKVLAGAMTAVSSNRLVRLVRKKFEQRIAADIEQLPTAKLTRLIGGDPSDPPEDMKALLARIDDADATTSQNENAPAAMKAARGAKHGEAGAGWAASPFITHHNERGCSTELSVTLAS